MGRFPVFFPVTAHSNPVAGAGLHTLFEELLNGHHSLVLIGAGHGDGNSIIAADAKTVAFGDFSYYWIADRQGRSFKRLNELYAATGQVGFLASQRVDGKLILPEAIKVLAQKSAG